MAKKANRIKIYCPYFRGYLDEMPESAKEKMKAEKPDMYKQIFKTL